MSKIKAVVGKSAQEDVQGENLNDFVANHYSGGKLKRHQEHDTVRRPERQINKFTRFTDKNRFTNAILFSQGSLDLAPEEKGDTPYYHASRINCPGGALILSAPMKETLVDFYRLIWQQRVNTIVCVVTLEDKEQCHPYFERKAGKKCTQRHRYRVRTVAVRPEGKNIVNYELKIENYMEKKENNTRVLNVIAISGWEPEQPFDIKTIVAAIHSVDAIKRIASGTVDNGKEPPMLIHGCTGIRRTGVFALAYVFSKQILGAREINLIGVIEQIRMVRYGVLRQRKMFYFLLEIIIALIAETGLVKPGSQEHMQAVQLIKKMHTTGARKKKSAAGGGKSTADKSEKSTDKSTAGDEDGDGGEEGDEEAEDTGPKKSPKSPKTAGSREKGRKSGSRNK